MMYFFRTDCEHFDMDCPEFPLADETREDLNKFQAMWGLFEEFNTGLQNLAKEDWISFRSRYYLFEEYLGQWYEKLKEDEPTTMTVRLIQEIEKYKVKLDLFRRHTIDY